MIKYIVMVIMVEGLSAEAQTAPIILPSVMQPTSSSEGAAVKEEKPKDYKSFRDPFKPSELLSEADNIESKTDLEKIPLSEIEILGVMTGPKKARAMLKVKNKDKTYFVTKGVKLGDREGEIIKVTTKSVTVREKVINPLGETETLDTEILMKENKK